MNAGTARARRFRAYTRSAVPTRRTPSGNPALASLPKSLQRDIRVADDLRPFVDLRPDPRRKLNGRIGDGLEAERCEPLLEFRRHHDHHQGAMQDVDDLARRAGRDHEASDDIGLQIG